MNRYLSVFRISNAHTHTTNTHTHTHTQNAHKNTQTHNTHTQTRIKHTHKHTKHTHTHRHTHTHTQTLTHTLPIFMNSRLFTRCQSASHRLITSVLVADFVLPQTQRTICYRVYMTAPMSIINTTHLINLFVWGTALHHCYRNTQWLNAASQKRGVLSRTAS